MRRIAFVACAIVLIVIINNLVRSTYELLKKQDIVTKAQGELEAEKKENQWLKRELAKVEEEGFIEKEARDKLFLVKPGEAEVILPETQRKSSVKAKDNTPNYQKWLENFGF